jgi:hypothetical protein
MQVNLVDLRGMTADRIEAYEEDRIEPTGNAAAAIMAVLGVTLTEVDGLLPWQAEALAAKLQWYERRAQASGERSTP